MSKLRCLACMKRLFNVSNLCCVAPFLFLTLDRGDHIAGVSWALKVRTRGTGQGPLANDTSGSGDNPFCAICQLHLPHRPTKIRLLHLKQSSWNPLRVEYHAGCSGSRQECRWGIQGGVHSVSLLLFPGLYAPCCVSDGLRTIGN